MKASGIKMPLRRSIRHLAVACGLVSMAAVFSATAATVWDRTIVHPMPTGRLLANGRCGFNTTDCAGTGLHLGVDLMAASGTEVVAMCDGVVRSNNTATADTWNSKVIVEQNCGGHLQAVFGHYGHIRSTLATGTQVSAGITVIGTVKNDGENSHLHMGLSYSQHDIGWGYGTSISDWIDFRQAINRPGVRPTLTSPRQNASTGNSASFVWTATTGSNSYRIVISREPNPLRNFNNYTRTCGSATNGSQPCWTNPDTLYQSNMNRDMTPGFRYYWVVRGDNTDWSEIGSFTVGPAM